VVIQPSAQEKTSGLRKKYYHLVGKLQYFANTRPDITFYVGKFSRSYQHLRHVHWRAGQRLLGYLGSTSDHGLTYRYDMKEGKARSPDDPLTMESYLPCRRPQHTEVHKQKSHSALRRGSICRNKRQSTVADSTTAAEIIALPSRVWI
jgi:hypothetical protein